MCCFWIEQMQCINGFLQVLPAATHQCSRLMLARGSCSKLFVGGLSYDTNEMVLKDAFTKYGQIIEVRVICQHVSGKSRGYGFVRFSSETAAMDALKEMDGQFLDGRNIRVQCAHRG